MPNVEWSNLPKHLRTATVATLLKHRKRVPFVVTADSPGDEELAAKVTDFINHISESSPQTAAPQPPQHPHD